MPVLTFKNQSGDTIKVNSADGSVPPDNVLDQLFTQSKVQGIRKDPGMQGGANAPDLVKAFDNVKKLSDQNQNMDILPSAAKGLQNMSWPLSLMYPKGAAQYQPTSSGGKLMADAGGVMNPIVGAVLEKTGQAIGGTVNYLDKSGQVKKALGMLTKQFTDPQGLDKSQLPRIIKEQGDQAVKVLHDQRMALNKKVLDVSDKTAGEIQSSLPAYFRQNSTIYGQQLDNISDGLVQSKNEITRGEMSKVMQETLNESQEERLPGGQPMQELQLLDQKYTLSPKASGILGADGKPIMIGSDPSEKLDFKDVVEDVKKVRNALSSKARAGVVYTPEDVVAAKFMQKWGDYLETKVPALRSLNQEYAPIIQTMKTAGKYFKPYSAGVDKIQGVSFLRQVANDKMQSTGKKLLDLLQNGTQRFPGIGNKTGDLEGLKAQQAAVKQDIDATTAKFAGYKKSAADWMAKEKALKDQKDHVWKVLKEAGISLGVAAGVGEETKHLMGGH